MSDRKLASIRRIKEIRPIEGADRIVCAVVDGWELVTQKSNNFQPGDLVVYFEIDSLLPLTEQFSFLEPYKVSTRNSVNGEGYRLKTIKLRGQVSQGLILSIDTFPILNILSSLPEGMDLTETLDVKLYERPIPAQLRGKVRGNFPSFIPKTDQERIQNCFDDWFFNNKQAEYEVTLKLDGSSCTIYYDVDKDLFGVCSRNLDLTETGDNAYWLVARKYDLENKLRDFGRNIAIQGELMGPGVQGNREKLPELDLFVFDIYEWYSGQGKYFDAEVRQNVCKLLKLKHVPVIDIDVFSGFTSVKDFLKYAQRPSINNDVAEGVVFKNTQDPHNSFKVISNAFLLGEE